MYCFSSQRVGICHRILIGPERYWYVIHATNVNDDAEEEDITHGVECNKSFDSSLKKYTDTGKMVSERITNVGLIQELYKTKKYTEE